MKILQKILLGLWLTGLASSASIFIYDKVTDSGGYNSVSQAFTAGIAFSGCVGYSASQLTEGNTNDSASNKKKNKYKRSINRVQGLYY